MAPAIWAARQGARYVQYSRTVPSLREIINGEPRDAMMFKDDVEHAGEQPTGSIEGAKKGFRGSLLYPFTNRGTCPLLLITGRGNDL
jgi:hypothetical protein